MAFDAKYAKECVGLDSTQIDAEFTKYTGDFAYWGARLAEARQEESLAKLTKETTAADLDVMAREALAGDKKPTEAMISAWVTRHAAMQEAEKNLIAATFEFERVRAVWDALRAKRDMLVGLGAQQRAEMQHEPVIKDTYVSF